MAEISRVLTRQSLVDYLRHYSQTSVIAIDRPYDGPVYQTVKSNEVERSVARSGSMQFFLKNGAFCTDDFSMQAISNKHMGRVFFIQQMLGEGHVRISFAPLDRLHFEVTVGHIPGFLTASGGSLPPTQHLKSFYREMASRLRKSAAEDVI